MQAASDVYAPVSGEVLEVNESLADDPSKVRGLGVGRAVMVLRVFVMGLCPLNITC